MGAKLFPRRLLASAAAMAVVVGGLVLVTPGTAAAAACGQSWSNKDPGGGAGITIPSQGQYTFPLHTGMYGDCRVTWTVSTGIHLNYDCYRRNSYGNTWTHLRVASNPSASGWAWDHYLNDGGSIYPC